MPNHTQNLRTTGIDPETNEGMHRLSGFKRAFENYLILHRCGGWLYAFGGINGDAAIVRRTTGRPESELSVEPTPDADGLALVRSLKEAGHQVLILQAKESP